MNGHVIFLIESCFNCNYSQSLIEFDFWIVKLKFTDNFFSFHLRYSFLRVFIISLNPTNVLVNSVNGIAES